MYYCNDEEVPILRRKLKQEMVGSMLALDVLSRWMCWGFADDGK